MRVLITGGAGYKGCVIADHLLDLGHSVTIFDRLTYGEGPALALMHRGAQVVRGDVTRYDQVQPQVSRHDAVIHLAALVGFPLCDAEPIVAEAVNVQGTMNVVKAMTPGQILVYASTGSVYGRVEQMCSEDSIPAPLTHYGVTKLLGEQIAVDAGGISLRFATIMGLSPCMRFDLLVNAFVYRAIHMGWMVAYQAEDRRSFLDVRDAARSYALALDRSEHMTGRVFNVGASELNLTKRQVIDAVVQRFPMRVMYEDILSDPDQRDYVVDFSRIAAQGFRPMFGLSDSIDQVGEAARLSDPHGGWRFAP